MYAIIEAGGSQYRLEVGTRFTINKIQSVPGADVSLDRVLLIADGDNLHIGNPYVSGAQVVATVLRQGRSKKIIVFKKKPKKGYKKTQGHRQYITELEIKQIKI